MRWFSGLALLICVSSLQDLAGQTDSERLSRFTKITLSEEFYSEGAAAGDIDGDGSVDIVSGPFWYSGPDFRQRHRYSKTDRPSIKGYSQHFFTWLFDVDRDGDLDIITIGMPGDAAYWFENPGSQTKGADWPKQKILDGVGNESPAFVDMTGDDIPELVCIHHGAYGWIQMKEVADSVTFEFRPISPNRGLGRFTHGLGVGDIDGDGRKDLVETTGWWRNTGEPNKLFEFHAYRFAEGGGAQMLVNDFDGDGDADVISSQNAHGYGLKWFEQRMQNGKIEFVPHTIMTDRPADHPYGLAVSQMHALSLADVDGDGAKDVITGKRYWAHGGADPGSKQLPLLFWLKTIRNGESVRFEPRWIDSRSGVGTQIVTHDLNGDDQVDVVIGNKLGTYVFINSPGGLRRESAIDAWATQPLQAGTSQFQESVRTSEPLTPEQEADSFILPPGFQIQLVAAEPEIAKPMNLAFDHGGRLWVSSSAEYPYAAAADVPTRDTIKILEDFDTNGRARKVTTFADQLNIPMGLLPYGKGVICFSAPYIWYLEDENRDDRVDKRTRLYGPFDTSRDTHGMCNSFTLAPDGWIYACHGFSNQSKVAGKDGHFVELNSGNVFRFRPNGDRIELVTAGQVNPFGMAMNRFGDLFTADCHTRPVNLILPGGNHDSFGRPHDGLGYIPDVMTHLHDSTGIGGVALGEQTAFPEVYQQSTFGGNVVTGRINRNRLEYHGSSMTAVEESDFVIPGDPWFRPVYLKPGPDGALYVADFYNRIIGHYEVDLDHPGRDRTRGRIWRIVYQPDAGRRDEAKPAPRPIQLKTASVKRLVNTLKHSKGVLARNIRSEFVRRIQLNQIKFSELALDHGDPNALQIGLSVVDSPSRLAMGAAHAKLAETRCQAFQWLAGNPIPPDDLPDLKLALEKGLQDDDPKVQRAAVLATSNHNAFDFSAELISLLNEVPLADRYLRHALKIALRNQLRADRNRMASIVNRLKKLPTIKQSTLTEFGKVCLSLKTSEAAGWIMDHISQLAKLEPDSVADYLRFSAQFAEPRLIPQLTELIQKRYATDVESQIELLKSLKDGLRQRGLGLDLLTNWASDLSSKLLDLPTHHSDNPTDYFHWNLTNQPEATPVFSASTSRSSADGQKNSLLWSSFVHGESKTGTFRSEPFLLSEKFSFFLAGHDGEPDKPLTQVNFVQLRLASSDRVIRKSSPPRNDVAQPIHWDTKPWQGKRAVIELVDGDSGGAYAWLAAGRFSVAGLNPSPVHRNWGQALELIREFKLTDVRPQLVKLVHHVSSPMMLRDLGETLVALESENPNAELLRATAAALLFKGIRAEQFGSIRNALARLDSSAAKESLGLALKVASATEQQEVARILAGSSGGAQILVEWVQQQKVSPQVLLDPTLREMISSYEHLKPAVGKLLATMPKVDPKLKTLMETRRNQFLRATPNLENGRLVFKNSCANCHQLAGAGNQVGPNLDGIGNRGLDRLLEDVLQPNRNVDLSFRSSLIATRAGKSYSGLVKKHAQNSDRLLLLFDAEGKQLTLDRAEIERMKLTPNSPMPANFGATLTEKELIDLMAFLLSTAQ